MKNFELTEIDANKCTIEELEKEISRLINLKNEYEDKQMSIKLFLNSVYGAAGSPWFAHYSTAIAEAVTLQGQDINKYFAKIIDDYFKNDWHLDEELHKKLGITFINKLNINSLNVYQDTDSCHKDSMVNTSSGVKTIEQWYIENKINGSAGTTLTGHESVITNDTILNWSKNKNLYFADTKRIIRHKVTKAKWKIRTKSGKEIMITNDHSIIVFRNNRILELKPNQIIKTDKLLCIK
jgi:DNA polymerase family B